MTSPDHAIQGGPLCSQCERGYFRAEYDGCLSCGLQTAWEGSLVLLVTLVLLGLAAVCLKDLIMKYYRQNEKLLTEYGQRGVAVFGKSGEDR